MKKKRSLSSDGVVSWNERGISTFISMIAAAEPLPAGGSAAALAGTLGAALGEMMAGLTEGRAEFAPVQDQVVEIHKKLAGLRNELQGLIREDAAVYQSLLEAIRMPRETESQRAARASAIEACARGATDTPLRTARAVLVVLECLKTLIEIGNPNARCDAAVGAQLAYASLKGAQYNILANTRTLKDKAFAADCRSEISALLLKGAGILKHVDSMVAARDGRTAT